jgi:uncharacterized protein YndB with AHSA1/START domain/predicted enzyme related to lactoylglutathione lyase
MNSPAASINTLTVKRLIKAPPERVFAAWTKPEEIVQWFGPETCQALSAETQPRAGGAYQIRVRGDQIGEVEVRGVYREVKAPSRLVFTWQWSGNPQLEFGESLVTAEFVPVDGATDIQVTHEKLPNPALRDDHAMGWNGCLDKLQKKLAPDECAGEKPALGIFCWNELLTSDLKGALGFYSKLFGWGVGDFEGGNLEYKLFKRGAKDVGGAMTRPMPQIPPHWLAYVHVANADATAQQAVALGGQVLNGPFDIPTVGRVAILHDPQGAVFGVFQPAR